MNAAVDMGDRQRWRGEYRRDEPLARHCTWRCGGTADHFFAPAERTELSRFLASAAVDPLFWLGFGSNVLVRDGGLRGTVIATTGLTAFAWQDAHLLYAEAGVSCARLARLAAAQDRAGLEFLAGIPGSLGGALSMNAGAHGGAIWNFVAAAELIDRQGQVRSWRRADFQADYRRVMAPQAGGYVGALLALPDSADGLGSTRIRQVLAQRNATQPTGRATCGSVFKNPAGDYAGRLIEQCGLKGHRIGGASVSMVHANFIVNEGRACAADIEQLIVYVGATVRTATGIELEPEVLIVGAPAVTDP